jgi:small multidrug resistance pump
MLTLAVKKFDISVVYAVWSGLGTALIASIGILYFREPVSAIKIISIALIIIGVAGLHIGGANH